MVYPFEGSVAVYISFTVACFFGFVCLYVYGDAKYLSLPMLHLLFVSVLFWIPVYGVEMGTFSKQRFVPYMLNIVMFLYMFRGFYVPSIKQNNRFYSAYTGNLDTFPYHWSLVLVAAAISLCMIVAGDDDKMKSRYPTPLWAIGYCLFPMSFLPQLWIICKHRVTLNIRFFLFWMLAYTAFSSFFTTIELLTCSDDLLNSYSAAILTMLLVIFACCCGKNIDDEHETDDDSEGHDQIDIVDVSPNDEGVNSSDGADITDKANDTHALLNV